MFGLRKKGAGNNTKIIFGEMYLFWLLICSLLILSCH